MTVKYHKFTIEGKEYKIKKMGLRDALWVSAQIGNITATPIISLILDFISSNKGKRTKAISGLNELIKHKDSLKEHILSLIKLISENIDLSFDIFEKMMEGAVVSEQAEGGTKETPFSIDDISIDDIDTIAQIVLEAVQFNFETGLKKVAKKFLSQELDQK